MSAEAKIRAHTDAMEHALIARDAKKVAQHYSPTATLICQGAHVQGREAIEKYYSDFFGTINGGDFQSKNNYEEINVDGDLASVRGNFKFSSGSAAGAGEFVFVLKRMADGKWYIHHDFFTMEMGDDKAGK